MKRKIDEEVLQKQIVSYFKFTAPLLQKEAILQSNRNENNTGGLKGLLQGKKYNDMGRNKGFPDLILLFEGRAIFIELKSQSAYKTKNHGLSLSQMEMHQQLVKMGFEVYVFCELEQFIDLLKNNSIV